MKVLLTEANPDPETLPPLDLDTPTQTAPPTEDTATPERTLKVTIVSRYRGREYSHSTVPEKRNDHH